MFTRDILFGAACFGFALAPLGAFAQMQEVRYGFGAPASQEELAKFTAFPPTAADCRLAAETQQKVRRYMRRIARLATASTSKAIRRKASAATS
jgi:hypothetical protein